MNIDYSKLSQTELLILLKEKDKQIQSFSEGIKDVLEIINNSSGVADFHLNGDNASWDSLLEGGHFEEWLTNFNSALKLIKGETNVSD